jgi:predicted phage terminase large subunit-like protein
MVRFRDTPLKVQERIQNVATRDGVETTVWLEQEPGSSGVADIANLTKVLCGFRIRVGKPTHDKITRSLPCSSQAEAGNIMVLDRPWKDVLLMELQNFPDAKHDDIPDSLTGGFNAFLEKPSIFDTMK